MDPGSKVTKNHVRPQKEWPVVSEKGAWFLDQVWRGTGKEGPWVGFEMSPGRRCGSGSAGRRLQVLVQHGDPLREQRIHIERELHGPLCGIGHAPQNVTSAIRAGKSLFPRPAPRIRPAPTVASSAWETPFFLLSQLFSSNRTPFVGLWPCDAMATKYPALPVNS